jgi:serine/threonine protein kinase
MGCNQSKPGLLSDVDGDGKDFLSIFMMDRILGQGEFGVVKMCYAKESSDSSSRTSKSSSKHKKSHHFLNDEKAHACKILRKGIQFKDNTIYSPIKAHVLQNECGILRTLGGRHHTLKLVGLYESPSTIYIVTDYLHGGDMFEYLSTVYGATIVYDGQEKDTGGGGGLRTEDVSRMSYELLDACNHCFKHGIMHRDIKVCDMIYLTRQCII